MSDHDLRQAHRAWMATPDDACVIERAVCAYERHLVEPPDELAARFFTSVWLREQAARLVRRSTKDARVLTLGLARLALAARAEGALDEASRLLAEAPPATTLESRILVRLARGDAAQLILANVVQAPPGERGRAACLAVGWIGAAGLPAEQARRAADAVLAGLPDDAVWRVLAKAGEALPSLDQADRISGLVERLSAADDPLAVHEVLERAALGPGLFELARPFLEARLPSELERWDVLCVPAVRALAMHADPAHWEKLAERLPPQAEVAARIAAAQARRARGTLTLDHLRVAVARAEGHGIAVPGGLLGLLARTAGGVEEARALIRRRVRATHVSTDVRANWLESAVQAIADVPALQAELEALVSEIARRGASRQASSSILQALAGTADAVFMHPDLLRAVGAAAIGQSVCSRAPYLALLALGRCVAGARALGLPERRSWSATHLAGMRAASALDAADLLADVEAAAVTLAPARRRAWLGSLAAVAFDRPLGANGPRSKSQTGQVALVRAVESLS